MESKREITWQQLHQAYLNCVSKVAEFASELTTKSHASHGHPSGDSRHKLKEESQERPLPQLSEKERIAFNEFAAGVRNAQPFLREASDRELEGIFIRLSPSERRRYSESGEKSKKTKGGATDVERTRVEKKLSINARAIKDEFINDDEEDSVYESSGDDVSLVSESDLEKEKLDSEEPIELKKAKHREEPSESKPAVPSTSSVKKFTWT